MTRNASQSPAAARAARTSSGVSGVTLGAACSRVRGTMRRRGGSPGFEIPQPRTGGRGRMMRRRRSPADRDARRPVMHETALGILLGFGTCVIVPLAIVGAFLYIVTKKARDRHAERMAMIEKGLV